MKRLTSICLLLLLILSGCAGTEDAVTEVIFYYQRAETAYGTGEDVIVGEEHTLPQKNPNLAYLLDQYLQGPLDPALKLPLPNGTQVLEIRRENHVLTLVFSPELSRLENMELSVACACVSYTCFSATDAVQIRIESASMDEGTPVSFTASRDTFLLFDDTTGAADAS